MSNASGTLTLQNQTTFLIRLTLKLQQYFLLKSNLFWEANLDSYCVSRIFRTWKHVQYSIDSFSVFFIWIEPDTSVSCQALKVGKLKAINVNSGAFRLYFHLCCIHQLSLKSCEVSTITGSNSTDYVEGTVDKRILDKKYNKL